MLWAQGKDPAQDTLQWSNRWVLTSASESTVQITWPTGNEANTYSCQTGPSAGSLWLPPPCPSSRFPPRLGALRAPGHRSAECSRTPASPLFLVWDLCSQADCLYQMILRWKHLDKQAELEFCTIKLVYLGGGKCGFSHPVEWIWAFFHRPSFLHSAAPGNMSDLLNLGLSDETQTHSYQLRRTVLLYI